MLLIAIVPAPALLAPALLGATLLGVTLLSAPGCTRPTPVIRHVVLVVFDATHAAHAGCYGGPEAATPNLDALSRRGARFEHAWSNATWTLPSTVSLMSGLVPERHGVVRANDAVPEQIPLLAERFAAAGFETASFVQMLFASDRHGLDRGFGTFRYHKPRDEALGALREDVRAFVTDAADRPSLLYVHLRRPHSPYDPPAEALAPFAAGHPLADGSRDKGLRYLDNAVDPQLDPLEQERLVQLYRGGLRAVDAELAWLVPLLDLDDDTLLVVTSDHGEGLGEHGDYGHGRGLHAEHVRIPLVMVGPGLSPRVIDDPVGTVDLLPTLLELTGRPAVPGLDGISLAPLLRGGPAPARRAPLSLSTRRYPGETVSAAIVDGTHFVRLAPDGPGTLYDTVSDPGQEQDLAARRPEVVARWRSTLEAMQHWQPGTDGPAALTAPGDEEDLRALGYVR